MIHPIAGQGLNLGLHDAAALAEVIVDALRLGLDPGSADVLEDYERARRADITAMGLMTDGLNRLFSNDLLPVRLIRDLGLGLVDRMPGLKRFFIREAAGLTGREPPRLLQGRGAVRGRRTLPFLYVITYWSAEFLDNVQDAAMTDTVIVLDGEDDLTPGQDARHEMAATLTGTTHLALTLTSTTLGGIKALGTQRIIVGSGFGIDTQLAAIALSGAASSVQNDGSIKSHAASAILFSGAGGSVDNKGTIEATGSNAAILGSTAADRIINTGTITAAAAGGVALDLKEGDDLYDGRSTGSVTGTVIGTIRLGSGNDIAYGGSGAETFSAGTDTNVIDGGTGTDTIDYSAAPVGTDGKGVMVNLATSTSQSTNYSWDTLLEIENVIGSAFSDTLTGSSDKNTLMGGAGDDTLDGGFDDDVIDGGDGDNTAKFSSSTAATVDLSNTAAQETGYGKDIFTNIRHLEGGSGADKFTGNGETNRLTGNSGNDTLNGAAGNDTLVGGNGNDSLQGGADVDRLQGDFGRRHPRRGGRK